MSTKKCSRCGEDKPLGEFNKKSRSNDGLRPECRVCQKEWYNKNKEEILSSLKVKYADNKELFYDKNKAYYSANRDKILSQKKDYRSRNAESIRLNLRKFYWHNREELLAKKSIYNKSDIYKTRNSIRNGIRRSIEKCGDVTVEQILDLKQKSSHCHWCNIELDDSIKIHLDHVFPLSKGGSHTISNIVISCARCNTKKGCKMPDVFMEELNNEK